MSRKTASPWIMALKIWNKEKGGKYTVPKKGTPEYLEVREIMDKIKRGEVKGGWLPILSAVAGPILGALLS